MADAKIIERIQGLLRMADPAKNPNENEREVAQRKAQDLMFKHNLSLMSVTEKEGAGGVKEDGGFIVEGVTQQWKTMFLWYIGKAWFCDGFFTKYSKSKSKMTLVGKPENIAFVFALYEHIVPWLEIECSAALAQRREFVKNPKAFKRAFYDAAGKRIYDRLLQDRRRMEETANRDVAGSGTALVRVENAAVEQYMEQLDLKKSKRRGFSDFSGQMSGDYAGRQADLTQGNKLRTGGDRKELGR